MIFIERWSIDDFILSQFIAKRWLLVLVDEATIREMDIPVSS